MRKLLGNGTLCFEPVEGGGYRLTGETCIGPLFEGCGAVCGAEEAVSTLRTGLELMGGKK